MTVLTIILLAIDVVLAVLMVIAIRKRMRVISVILGFICAGIAAVALSLGVFEKPMKYMDQTKESYLAMQEDKNVSSFRIMMDNKIMNSFPEWDEEHPFHYIVDYRSSEIRIYTDSFSD